MSESGTETNFHRKEFKIGDPYPDTKDIIHILKWKRDAYIDEIPDRIIEGQTEYKSDKFYKVRKNWFQGLIIDFHRAIKTGSVKDNVLQEEIEKFNKKYSVVSGFNADRLTTAEDIAEANALITKIVGDKKPDEPDPNKS